MFLKGLPITLRSLLLLDASTCAAMGALMTLGAGALAEQTAIPEAVLFYAGVALFPIAALMVMVATRWTTSSAVWLVIAGNALWVAASLWLMLSGWIAPNALGYAFLAIQALAVATLAALEHASLPPPSRNAFANR
jgi:hypothetical protein